MPGPNSAPNGDRSIVSNEAYACDLHGQNFDKCIEAKTKAQRAGKQLPNCRNITKREFLLRKNRLFSGKTLAK